MNNPKGRKDKCMVSIYLPTEKHLLFKRLCELKGVSRVSVMREGIALFIQKYETVEGRRFL